MHGMHLHHGNRLESLAAALGDSLHREFLQPMAAHTVIVESGALARWLRLQLCARDGIAMQLEMPLPAAWLWQMAARDEATGQNEDPLSRERLHWLIHDRLAPDSALLALDGTEPLRRYLHHGDGVELRRWQLAGRIADAFDRYQYYRPDLLRRWERDTGDRDWQAWLWRDLVRSVPTHRIARIERLHEALKRGRLKDVLPRRLDLFSIHNLPPLLLSAYAAIAECIPVHLWLLSPTADYWADLASPQALLQKRIEHPEDFALWQAGNPLLTQWGRQGQAFQDLLLEHIHHWAEEEAHFEAPARNTLLANVQADIFDAVDDEVQAPQALEADDSIQVHIAHGPLRECEILRDTLLHHLNDDPELEPEDILVMVPDIGRYAPYIEAVFGHGNPDLPKIPYNLSDVAPLESSPMIQAFLKLLDLPDWRFTRGEMAEILHVDELRRRFGLDEDDLRWLDEWFERLRVFWGLDGSDKARRLHLPPIDENTWHHAFVRTMAGFAIDDEDMFHDIAPAPLRGSQEAERAARFFVLLDKLRDWSRQLVSTASAGEWANRLHELVEEMFDAQPDDPFVCQIHDALAGLAEVAPFLGAPLALPVVRAWLSETLATPPVRGRFYSGGITFCQLQPLRGVPFRIVALLGMQEDAFPRRKHAAEFDHMRDQWRHGDPDPTHEDRFLFLETLLAARKRLILCYTGRDAQNNEPLHPSIVVQELLDYLDARYRVGEQPAGQAIQHVHGLQPFSPRNFQQPAPSFDRWWKDAAVAILRHVPPSLHEGWPDWTLKPQSDSMPDAIEPSTLARALRHPIRCFVRQHLRLSPPREAEWDEDEPFGIDGLDRWRLHEELLVHRLIHSQQPSEHWLRARGLLPHGAAGSRMLKQLQHDMETALQAAALPSKPLRRATIDIRLPFDQTEKPPRAIEGRLRWCFDEIGLLQWLPGEFRPADAWPVWIEHLCLHACAHPLAGNALIVCPGGIRRFRAIADERARAMLAELMGLYRRMLCQPVPLFRKASSAYVQALYDGKSRQEALEKASKAWHSSHQHRGESEEFPNALILRASRWSPDAAFAELAERTLLPMLEHMEDDHA